MIIEGLVTTVGPAGACHVAPMGPRFENSEWDDSFELAPFQGSATLRHLVEHPEGVFHLDDRVMLFAQLIVGGWGGLFAPLLRWLPDGWSKGFVGPWSSVWKGRICLVCAPVSHVG